MSAGLAASTVTPGSTAPDESFTTPVMDAWAYAEAGRITHMANTGPQDLQTAHGSRFFLPAFGPAATLVNRHVGPILKSREIEVNEFLTNR